MPNEAEDNGFDLALEKILHAAGTSLKHYMPATRVAMRAAMREVMMKAYTDGSMLVMPHTEASTAMRPMTLERTIRRRLVR